MVIPFSARRLAQSLGGWGMAQSLGERHLRGAAELVARLIAETRGEVVIGQSSLNGTEAEDLVAAWVEVQARSVVERLSAQDPEADLLTLLRTALAKSRAGRARARRRFIELEECRSIVDRVQRAKRLDPRFAPVETAQLLTGSSFGTELVRVARAARQRILISSSYFAMSPSTPSTLRQLLSTLGAVGRSADVRVVLDGHQGRRSNASVINRATVEQLSSTRAQVRIWRAGSRLHAKFVVVDDHHVLIGSHNLTAGSLFHYRDVSILVESAGLTEHLADYFERLWNRAEEPSAEAAKAEA